MEFDWTGLFPEAHGISKKEVEESFEDPFSLRIMPDTDELSGREARYFCLGRSVSGMALFSVFWTDGKLYRIIFSRPMAPDEETFFERKGSELLS